ncbi:cytochrome c maturation protein CcmE [Microvirga sp. CF3062]|uniref:cytochrome c maturation protein CcmE n=1 Tax=Microvirga sp. CF3062 TaxID=3110182 RepID=UPI002E7A0530|nr:cytochrome c maturation protein CcmE [Microvirga sp. CF3062]MEE1654896.1 cytochrome c maturation protein CcmE [Microvirga sp. CF3062]
MTRKQRRLTLIGVAGCVLAVALGLVLYAMNDTIVFFNSPADIQAKSVQPGTRIRLGGLVKEGSVQRGADQQITFEVMDAQAVIKVNYKGLLPDLFREGQGIVAEGILESSSVFRADSVLAKHDENYMPREVADALKKQGHWQGEANAAPKKQ